MLKTIINDNKAEFEITSTDDLKDLDLIKINENQYHLIHQDKSYNILIVHQDLANKTIGLRINNNNYSIQIKDDMDLLLEKMGIGGLTEQKVNDIKAPMPGLVLSISVEEGSEVQKGDVVLVLEAMKMENSIKASGNGKVKNISIKKGDVVEKGQLLIELE